MNDPANRHRLSTIPAIFKAPPHDIETNARLCDELQYVVPSGDCLITLHRVGANGYRRIKHRGRSLDVHRLLLERKLGRHMEPWEHTRHICHRRNCINPDHLIPGSAKDNSRDRDRAGRQRNRWSKGKPVAIIAPVADCRAAEPRLSGPVP